MRSWLRTRKGHVVYKRKKHPFTVRSLYDLVSRYVNKHPPPDAPDWEDQEVWNDFQNWKNLWFLAQNQAIGLRQRLFRVHGYGTVFRFVEQRDVTGAVNAARFVSTGRDFLQQLADYAWWVPFIGEVSDAGIRLIDYVIESTWSALPDYIVDYDGTVYVIKAGLPPQ